MNVEERLALVRQVGEEIVTEEELRALLEAKAHPIAYDGFEPSGTIHIAQGLLRAINVNKMTKAGCRFKMFVADWHAWANNKMGGDLGRIQTTGRYITEVWKATGMDLANVDFVWASEFIEDESYWKKVMNVARDTSLDRVLRTTQIMGRSDKDKLSAAQILYPCMQAADIFHLKADITQLGMDQRKVNMLAREVGPKLGFWKPVVVSHHMLMGLQQPPATAANGQLVSKAVMSVFEFDAGGAVSAIRQGDGGPTVQLADSRTQVGSLLFDAFKEPAKRTWADLAEEASSLALHARELASTAPEPEAGAIVDAFATLRSRFIALAEQQTIERATAMKMSKSNPDTAIFMTDTPQQVESKLKKAYCPEKVVAENPVLEYMRYIVFERAPAVTIERPEKFGGTVSYHSYAELEAAFAEGKLHPADLKKACAKHVNDLLQPVRDHFEKDEKARALKAEVESFKVTR